MRQLFHALEGSGADVGWQVEPLNRLVRLLYYRRFVGIFIVQLSILISAFKLRKAVRSVPGRKAVLVTQPTVVVAFSNSQVPVAYWCLSAESDWWHLQSRIEKGYSIFNSRIEVRAARAATWVISLSDRVSGILEVAAKVRVHSIPYGVDTDFYTPAKRMSDSTSLTVLFVGVVREVKGIDVLVEACGTLVGEFPLKLKIVGPISPAWRGFADRLSARARAAGLNLEFSGYMTPEKLSRVMASSDVLVLPSKKEAQGNVILEAMASGIPVVCSRVGGMPELVRKNACGRVFEPNNVSSLATQLRELLADRQLREQLGANGREASVNRYSWEAVTKALMRTLGL